MKNSCTIVLLCLFAPFQAEAQQDVKTNSNRFSLGIMVSPDYCYRILRSDNDNFKTFRQGIDEVGLGLTGGILIRREAGHRWQFESGVVFTRHRISSKSSIYGPDLVLIGKMSLNYDYQFVQIPVRVNHIIIPGERFRAIATSGLGLSITHKAIKKGEVIMADGSKSQVSEVFDKANFPLCLYGMVGCGVEYKTNERLNFGALILYRQHLTRVYAGTDIDVRDYPYSIGINLSCFYTFQAKQKTE